jgi:ribose transport system permease protein
MSAPSRIVLGVAKARRVLGGRGSILGLLIIIAVATAISPGFLTIDNLRNLLSQSTSVGVIALAMTLLILTRDFDLSVGGIYAIASVEAASITNAHGLGVAVAVIFGIGVLCGLINGLIVVVARVNSFVATLGTGSIYAGLAYEISHNQATFVNNAHFRTLGVGRVAGLPVDVIALLVVFVLGVVLLRMTVFGRHVYAIGGSPEAAYLAGARVTSIRISIFIIVGICSALGGFILTSQVGVGEANIGGVVPLQAIAIVVVGGTSLGGGEGNLSRTIVGLLILNVLNNVTNALALNSSTYQIVEGIVIVFAVAADGEGFKRLRALSARSVARRARTLRESDDGASDGQAERQDEAAVDRA